MRRLNNKGYSLIELLAVVVILGILSTILVSTVGYLINKNNSDNYNNIKNSILSAAKIYMSDNRYDIKLVSGSCVGGYRSIDGFNNDKLYVSTLVANKSLSSGAIKNPKENGKVLDKANSYVIVKYDCSIKDYVYGCFDDDESFSNCASITKSHLAWSNS